MHKRQTDDEIFAVTSNNTVAAEAHYFPNCCCFYMKSEEDKNISQNRLVSWSLIMQKKKVLQIKTNLHSLEISYNEEVVTMTDARVRLSAKFPGSH